jgi:hypothetical protein
MARWTPLFVAATLAMVCAGTPGVRAFDRRAHVAGLEVRDPVLYAALVRIQRGSVSWRTALARRGAHPPAGDDARGGHGPACRLRRIGGR